MRFSVRRMGIALGSYVAASLAVWLVLGLIGGGPRPEAIPSATATFASVVLGFLIYRDIARRDQKRPPVAGKTRA